MTAADLYEMKVIDGIIEEPEDFTEKNIDIVLDQLAQVIDTFLMKSGKMSEDEIVESRYHRFRSF